MADSVANSTNKILSRCAPSLFSPSAAVAFRLGAIVLRPNHAPIALTQEFLAQMLGTRTAGVNEAISTLTSSGLIGHRRQLIEIIDRRGLEAESCECYAVVKTLYGRDHVM